MMVRESNENDFPAVSKIISTVFSKDLQMITGRAVDDSLILPFIRKCGYDIYVAESQTRVLGVIVISKRKLKFLPSQVLFYLKNFGAIVSVTAYLRLRRFRKKFPKKLRNEYFIEAIAVAEKAQDRGIGKRLIGEAEKILTTKKAEYLGLVVKAGNPAEGFYKALGFIKIKNCVTKAFGEWHYMRKRIS